MHIEITYGDGTTENVPVHLEGMWVYSGGAWIPGDAVMSPSDRCYFRQDFFECALDEGHERSGSVEPEEGDEDVVAPFTWKLVGTEEDACREMLARWRDKLGHFDPTDPEAVPADQDVNNGYRRDCQCWNTYLEDPAAELAALAGPAPR